MTFSRATGINQSGLVVGINDSSGFFYTRTGGLRPLKWWPGLPAGNRNYQTIEDVSDKGQIVGTSYDAFFYHARPLIWTSPFATPTLIPIPGAGDSYAFGINTSGVVVGAAEFLGAGHSHTGPEAWVWSPATGMHNLHPPGALHSVAQSINGQGYITGWVEYFLGGMRAARWSPSWVYTDLGGDPAAITTGVGINSSGQIVGYSEYGPPEVGLAWASAPGIGVSSVPGSSWLKAISAKARVVGDLIEPVTYRSKAFTSVLSLPGSEVYLPPLPGAVVSAAADVNACGLTVGYSLTWWGGTTAVLWTPPACDP